MVSHLLWVTKASGTHIQVHIPKPVFVPGDIPTVRMTPSATFPGNVKHLNYAINSLALILGSLNYPNVSLGVSQRKLVSSLIDGYFFFIAK